MITKVDNKIMLSDRAYSFGKNLAQLYLPAFGTLYFTLASLWGLPASDQVVGTTVAVATFIGVTLRISSAQYDSSEAAFDGTIGLEPNDEGTAVKFSLDPSDVENKDSITLKVVEMDPLGNLKPKKTRKSRK